jgi:hypothetical protein
MVSACARRKQVAYVRDLLGSRRREALAKKWPEVPEWVFCSKSGTALDERNFERLWYRLRRRAQRHGIRPLKLHTTRHTWATFALQAGKSIRWVADQLGHADPALTLRVYAHAMPGEERDLSFAEFGGPGRPYTAPESGSPESDSRNPVSSLVGRQGLEPWTLGLKARSRDRRTQRESFSFRCDSAIHHARLNRA